MTKEKLRCVDVGFLEKLKLMVAWATVAVIVVSVFQGIDAVHLGQTGMLLWLILAQLWRDE